MSEISSWADHELEYLNRCPVCGSSTRELRYPAIKDRICETRGNWDYYQCRSCSVLYVDPRPTEQTIGRVYEHYYTHAVLEERERVGWLDKMALGMRNDYLNWKYGYKKQPTCPGGRWLMYLLPPWLRLEWDHLARNLPIPEPGKNRLLDVGCGNGDFLVMAQTAGWDCSGVDFDELAVETARTQGLDVSLGGVASQKYPSDNFDAITLSHVIEHVHNPKAILDECARLLKPGGILWVATPNADSVIHRWFKEYWLDLMPPQHLILFDAQFLRILIEKLGFKVRVERRGVHVQSKWRASQALQQGKTGLSDICMAPFMGRKILLRHWLLELLSFIFPPIQGDIVIRAIKN